MAKQSKLDKQIAKTVEGYFYQHSKGIQIGIFDLGKISKAGADAYPNGLPAVEAAVIEAIAKYGKPA
jgi:hypothetical protein